MEELQVKKVYFAKQIKESENYKKFLEIANRKHIKIYEAVAGKRIVIEKNYILIFYGRQITKYKKMY